MSEPTQTTPPTEPLALRAKPRGTTRINRKVVIVGFGLGVLALFAAASIALAPPKAADPSQARELYNTTNARPPEALNALPASYAEIAPVEERIARLGPPLPGDLGGTIAQVERDLGIEYGPEPDFTHEFRPNPNDEAERARKIEAAKLEAEAASAPVFFALQTRSPSGNAPSNSGIPDLGLGSQLLAIAASGQGGLPSSSTRDANLQSRKLAFAGEPGSSDIYNQASVETPASPYQIMAGTLIPASLVTGLNSDLPGTIIAQVTQPVYDTVTGQYLLVPQGSRLIGRYQSEVSFGQDRALLTWDRIIFPDGSSITISAPGADASGYAGISDRTDHHWSRVFAAAGLATILGIGSELGSDDDGISRAVRRGFGDSVNQSGQRIVDRNLAIQPTIKVRPGWPIRVIVTRDLILRPHSATNTGD